MTRSPDSLCIPAQTAPRTPLPGSEGLLSCLRPRTKPPARLTRLEPAVGVRGPERVSAPAGELSPSQVFLSLQEVDSLGAAAAVQPASSAGQGARLPATHSSA